MAQLNVKRPFRTAPTSPRDFERFIREDLTIEAGSLVATDIADDAVTTTKLVNSAVTLSKLADLTADRIIGRLTTDGVAQELTPAQVVALLQAVAWTFSAAVQFDGNVGFHGEAPTAQQSDPGAPSIATVSGSGDDTNINANFSALESTVNDLRTILNTKGLSA